MPTGNAATVTLRLVPGAVAFVAAFLPTMAAATERLTVTVIDRQGNCGAPTAMASGNCGAGGATSNCPQTATSTTTSSPVFGVPCEVGGATLSLQLPDGRVVVVNCAGKTNWTEWDTRTTYRSCRVPLAVKVQVEFDGDKAKLRWPVSIDGKKFQSETYRILGVIDPP